MSEHRLFGNLFLSAGAMKAGTTWLFAVLQRHPDLYFTPEKEIHYFYHRYVNGNVLNDRRRLKEARDRYILRFDPAKANIEYIRRNLHWVAQYLSSPIDDFWYRGLFAYMRNETYGCDFSNLYAHLPAEAWSRISAQCDRLRVLYTLRHPVKRLWSHVRFQLQLSGDLGKLQTWSPEELRSFSRQPHIWDNAEYGRVLRSMSAGLAPEMLKVILYEDLHADHRKVLAEIEDFLDIARFDYPEALLSRRINESVKSPMPEFFPGLFAEDFERIMDEVEAEGLAVPASWRIAERAA